MRERVVGAEYIDEQTGLRMIVSKDKSTYIPTRLIEIDDFKAAITRLEIQAGFLDAEGNQWPTGR